MPIRRFRSVRGRGGKKLRVKVADPLRVDPSRTNLIRQKFFDDLRVRISSFRRELRKLILDDDAFGIREREPNGDAVTHHPSGTTVNLRGIVGLQPNGGRVSSSSDGRFAMLLRVPDVRQDDEFSCGAASAAAGSLGLWLGLGPRDLDGWKTALGTTPDRGTTPEAVAGFFGELGAQVEARDGMSIDDLTTSLRRGWGVLCPIQDYRSSESDWDHGHWVLVVGRVPGYVVVQDPSIDNALDRPGGTVQTDEEDREENVAARGKKLIRDEDWVASWRDRTEDGTEYVRYGVAVGPPKNSPIALFNSMMPTREQVDEAAAETDRDPTEGQKESGDYDKGIVTIQGLRIRIENPKGTVRSGNWMQDVYGYIEGTVGADGDELDVFVGPNPESRFVYVVDQSKLPDFDGFDEHKVMVGYLDELQARQAYLHNFEPGWRGMMTLTELTIDEFRRWLRDGDPSRPISEHLHVFNVYNPDQVRDSRGRWVSGGLSQDDFKSENEQTTEQVIEGTARRLAEKWDVSIADLEALNSEEDLPLPDDHEQAKRVFVSRLLNGWAGSSGGAVSTAVACSVADALGLDYELREHDRGTNDFIQTRPGMQRAVDGLARAMYQSTQEWLRERGIKELTLLRAGDRAEDRPFSSWSLSWGGVRTESGREVVTERVPAEYVLSVPPTGFGTLAESEVVVLPRTKPITSQTFNAFCPTGKGGGIDPHCSPRKSGGGTSYLSDSTGIIQYHEDKFNDPAVKAHIPKGSVVIGHGMNAVAIVTPNGRVTRILLHYDPKESTSRPKSKAIIQPKSIRVVKLLDGSHVLIEKGMPKAEKITEEEFQAASAYLDDELKKIGLRLGMANRNDIGKVRGKYVLLDPGAISSWKRKADTHNSFLRKFIDKAAADTSADTFVRVFDATEVSQSKEMVTNTASNAFCPTGKGGGVDPSCSPDGGLNPNDRARISDLNQQEEQVRSELERTVGIDSRLSLQGKLAKIDYQRSRVYEAAADRTRPTDSEINSSPEQEKWETSLTDAERMAFKRYQNAPYDSPFSSSVRYADARGSGSKEAQETAKMVRSAMDRAPKHEVHAFRGMSLENEDLLKVGATIEQDTFTSWSRDRKIAGGYAASQRGPIKVIFHAKTRAVDVARLGSYSTTQKELLVDKNKWRVVGVRKATNGFYHVDVEEVPLTSNERFRFNTTAEKLEAFRRWLKRMVELKIVKIDGARNEDYWWKKYAEWGYRNGAGRAFDDVRKPYAKGYAEGKIGGRYEPGGEYRTADGGTEREGWKFEGGGTGRADWTGETKEDFLRSSFGRPVAREKIELLAGRTYTDLVGVTEKMATSVMRGLTDGLVRGDSPRDIASELDDVLDAYENQALTVARTEIIRAHSEGNLDALEALGVEELGVAVEWTTSGLGVTALGNPSPCRLCAELQGVVLTVEEARGLLPRHPNCMCTYVPANVGEDGEGQIYKSKDIRRAIDASIAAEVPAGSKRSLAKQRKLTSWAGADAEIDDERPESILDNTLLAVNRSWYRGLVRNRSFFADCLRDEKGRCMSVGSGAVVGRSELRKIRRLAMERAEAALGRHPSRTDIREINRKIDELGADRYESQIRGNSKDRAASRKRLLREFGNGKTCGCTYCGLKLDEGTVTRDKILTARQGGRYTNDNLVPACLGCNQARGDTPWEEIEWQN